MCGRCELESFTPIPDFSSSSSSVFSSRCSKRGLKPGNCAVFLWITACFSPWRSSTLLTLQGSRCWWRPVKKWWENSSGLVKLNSKLEPRAELILNPLLSSGGNRLCSAWFLTSPVSSPSPAVDSGWRECVLTSRVATFLVISCVSRQSNHQWWCR